MLHGLSRLIVKRPWTVVIAGIALFLVAGAVSGTVQSLLTTDLSDYDAPDAPGVQARADIEAATGIDYQQGYLLLVRAGERLDPAQPPPAVVTEAVALLESRPEVVNIIDYSGDRVPALISDDAQTTYVVGEVGELDERDAAESLQAAVEGNPVLRDRVTVGGPTVANVQIADISGTDLARAEILAFPILLLLLFLLFRGVVAALLPLVGAIVVTTLSLAAMRLVISFVDLSVFSLNLLFALSLGLSIDFCLLMLARYREQLAATGDPAAAVARVVPVTGRTILFSGLTVAVALATLLLFPQRFLYSMGVAGVLASVSSVLFAVLLLPAILRLLGHRVNALAPKRLRYREPDDIRTGWWYRFSLRVMRRPVAYAVGAGAVLILAGIPFLGIRYTGVDASILPASFSAGAVDRAIEQEFDSRAATPVRIAAYAPASASDEVAGYAKRLAAVPGVAAVAPPRSLSSALWEVDVFLDDNQISTGAQGTVGRLAEVDAGFEVRMTGLAADFVQRQDALGDRLPWALTVITVTTFLLLFAFTGSVVLPLKQLVINFLTISAALGVMVLVFQNGQLTGVLDYTSQGALESTTPIILFCIVFGLSTDYGVFLFGRIKEAHDAGNPVPEAVSLGLARTGRIVTSAAALVCVAIGALMISRILNIKELGLGGAFGIAVDATLARAVLVPALMALLKEYNWWAPPALRRVHAALRLNRVEQPLDPLPEAAAHASAGR